MGANTGVDESLFGAKKTSKKPLSDVLIVGKDTIQKDRRMQTQAATATVDSSMLATVIAASDLNRIKDSTKLVSKASEAAQKRIAGAAKAEKEAKSKARKEKMLLMEEERKMKMAMQMTDFEKEEQASTNGLLQKAKDKMDESHDDVKHMNQMMMYSKVVTIRDAQVQEKRYIHQEREEEESQLDTMMEIERLKALKMYEERNKARAIDQRKGAQVIIEQIKDRQTQRLREEEARDQERSFILKQIQAMKQEEIELQKAKKVAASKLMAEVAVANAATMKIKEEKILAERLDDQQILEYQRAKELREREIEEEKKKVAAEREAETAKLRAAQEKAADKAAEMDALRAKRAFEAAERAARGKEQQERARVSAINEELSVARKRQTAEKERRLAEQAKAERDEFDRIIEVQIQQEQAERTKQADEKKARYLHCDELRQQIAAGEERQLQQRRNALEEGNNVRSELAAERRKLEKIKTKKIEELKKCGVPEKYWSELAKKKIAV
ncbi:unnamed protein product [Amoebophrya sp. A25]|nr:unnamed protein product [Amoebophrya sp. A25]|eukprot:GSA25T00024219001.1